MALSDQVRPEHTAVLVIDTQNDYVHPRGECAKRRGVHFDPARVQDINALIHAARAAAIQVIYIRVVHSKESMVATKRVFRPSPDDVWPVDGTWGAELYEDLTPPVPGDISLTKHNYDSFDGTSLLLHLRALAIRTVVVTGFSTEVCVDTTVRSAFHNGYYAVVPKDCTGGFREESHAAALDVLERFFAKVVSADELVDLWTRKNGGPSNTSR